MAPVKKKGTERKRVLVLESRQATASSSVSSWQGKYQQLMSRDGPTQQNTAESISSTTPENPLTGLVGQYDSDSESDSDPTINSKVDDFLKEIEFGSNGEVAPSTPLVPDFSANANNNVKMQLPGSVWLQCYDQTSGYPYYWNQITNQVSWSLPQELIAGKTVVRKTVPPPTATTSAKSDPKNSQVKKKKYPLGKDSESEDEKIELITSYGDSEEESESSDLKHLTTKNKLKAKFTPESSGVAIGPQLPPQLSGLPTATKSKSSISKKKSKNRALPQNGQPMVGPQLPPGMEVSLDETPDIYETSSLMTPLVPDTGPPGTDNGGEISTDTGTGVADSSAREPSEDDLLKAKSLILKKVQEFENEVNKVSAGSNPSSDHSEDEDILSKLKVRVKALSSASDGTKTSEEAGVSTLNPVVTSNDPVDDIMAIIEQETPPDYVEPMVPKQEAASTPFKLIANYGDDSDTEENLTPVPKKKEVAKPLFPSALSSDVSSFTPTLPSAVEADSNIAFSRPQSPPQSKVKPNPFATVDADLPDSTTTHKAFKRKKRIEVAPASTEAVVYPSTSTAEFIEPVTESSNRYHLDPSSNEHRGFGFSTLSGPSTKRGVGIQFIKAETINFTPPSVNNANDNLQTPAIVTEDSSIRREDVEDAAELLGEKLEFLGGGKEAVSVVQQMAIQLEILVSAWQAGALTLTYLSNWLATRSLEVMEKEVTAAPPGWTCIWDRKTKRYFYRSKENGAVVWDYPGDIENEEEESRDMEMKETDAVVEKQVEMELSNTPTRPSTDSPPSSPVREPMPPPPPSPPVISSRSDTPPPPPPPIITIEGEPNAGLVSSSSEDKLLGLSAQQLADEPPPPGMEDLAVKFVPPLPVILPPPPPPPPDSSSSASALKSPKPSTSVSSSNAHEASTSRTSTKRKRNLTSELDSFYADLAKLEGDGPVSTSDQLPVAPPPPPPAIDQPPPPPPPDQPNKKKKKVPTKIGKSLKKKGVSSLVAKWQMVQEEARRKYGSSGSDEEDVDVSSTFK